MIIFCINDHISAEISVLGFFFFKIKPGDFEDTCLESSLSQHLSNQELPIKNITVDIKRKEKLAFKSFFIC